MKDKTLLLMVGLPRSGKSTWAMDYSKRHNVPVVNPDAIRLAMHGQTFLKSMEPYVWAVARTMVKTLFQTGYDRVILDATNLTKRRRNEWLSKDWDLRFKFIDTKPSVCIERAKANDQDYLVPVINRMVNDFEPFTEEESERVLD